MSRRRAVAGGTVVVVLGGVGLALVVDEGGRPTRSTEVAGSVEEVEDAAFRFTECMRDEGIDDYPEPNVEADGSFFFEDLSGLGVSGEEMSAAQAVCEPILEEIRPDGSNRRHVDPPPVEGWEQIVPGGDCRCAGGEEFSFYVREGDPTKVMFFLDGGGACWSAATCAPGSANAYQTTVEAPAGDGVLAFTDERNPFADHSAVFVPYCTGDLHIGDSTTEYAADLTVQHKGYVNGTAALDHLAATFPNATELVIVGASSGSAAAPLYAGLASDLLPDAEITVIADSSGSYPDEPELNRLMADVWGTGDVIPDWPETADLTVDQWSIPGLFVNSGLHDPDIVFARHDYAYDEEQTARLSRTSVPTDDLLALIDRNEALIENAGVNVFSYVAPGTNHLAVESERFYTETVDGEPLVDWVSELVEGNRVGDVRCTDCRD